MHDVHVKKPIGISRKKKKETYRNTKACNFNPIEYINVGGKVTCSVYAEHSVIIVASIVPIRLSRQKQLPTNFYRIID